MIQDSDQSFNTNQTPTAGNNPPVPPVQPDSAQVPPVQQNAPSGDPSTFYS